MNLLKKIAASSAVTAMALTSMPSLAATNFAATSFSAEPARAHGSQGPLAEEATEYRRRYRRYRRSRVRAGDIIAGIGILAGIAVIASAASKNSRRDRRDRRGDYPQRRSSDDFRGNDLGAAVSACSNAAEQSAGEGARVEEIRSAARDGNGWRVSGELNDTRSFDCGVSGGQIDFIQLGAPRQAI